MRDLWWKDGLPVLLIFIGLGLLLITALVGFLRLLLALALPLGVLLIIIGVIWALVKPRRYPTE